MWSSLKSDLKSITQGRILINAILAMLIIILFLKFIFPLISGFIFSKNGTEIYNYYPIIAITLISVIPVIIGILIAYTYNKQDDLIIQVSPSEKIIFIIIKMMFPTISGYLMILITAFVTDPVPSQGWLRTIFISALLSGQTTLIFLLIVILAVKKTDRVAISILPLVFIASVPFGLLVHHPWIYLAFFSPLYWISWAWVIPGAGESIIYGGISLLLTIGGSLVIYRYLLVKERH